MKEEISSIFLHKLPSPFLLQYIDADGDKVSISTEQEFQILLKNELSNLPSLKIYIVSLEGERTSLQKSLNSSKSNSNGSFEVVDDEQTKAEGIKELNLSKDEELQEEGKIVVSLQIPQMNTNSLKTIGNIEDSQTDETMSPPLKSKEIKSGDLIEDLSLSFEDERNSFSPKVLEKGFQTEAEEGFKENQKKSLNAFISRMETRRKAAIGIQESSEKESKELKEYLNKIIAKKSQIGRIQSSPKITKLLYCSIKNSEEKSSKEESQERWVSFSSEQEEMQTPVNIEAVGNSLKQKQEDWLDCYQEKSDRYKEVDKDNKKINEDKEMMHSIKRGRARRRRSVSKGGRSCSGLSSISLKSKSRSRSLRRRNNTKKSSLKRRRVCIELSRRSRSRDLFEVEKSLSLLKEEEEVDERKGKYRELRQWSDLEKAFQRNLDDSREIKEVDIWSDPPYPQYYFQNNMQNFMDQNKSTKENDMSLINGRQNQVNLFKDLCESLEKDIPENIQIALDAPVEENIESMNASLLTDSEAKEMASAIGCLHKIKEIKTLKFNENLFVEKSNFKIKQSNPTFNKWVFKEQEEKEKERKLSEDNWFSPQKDSFWMKKDIVQSDEKRPQEGTFCMRCWENPICGPVYTCLICEYVEYCEKCAPQITHIHTLNRIGEAKVSKSDKNLPQDEEQNSFCDFKIKLKEKSLSEDIDPLGKSLENSLNLWTYQPVEEQQEKFKFEYKEISSTPLSIKSNQREWCLIYKTVCLKNTGQSQWGRCHLEPIGQIAGTMTEVSYVAPGDSVLLTLEIHGFFTPGKYTSQWRVVHQGQGDVISEMGHLNLDFEILENRGLSLMDDMEYEIDLRRGGYLEEEKGDWKF